MNNLENSNRPTKVELGKSSFTHTARINEGLFDVLKLREFSSDLPVENFTVESLRSRMFSLGNNYWTDTENKKFDVAELLNNWGGAQNNPLWSEHVEKIQNADLSYPVWLHGEHDTIVDGAHRIAHALINQIPGIPMQRWVELPSEAKLE